MSLLHLSTIILSKVSSKHDNKSAILISSSGAYNGGADEVERRAQEGEERQGAGGEEGQGQEGRDYRRGGEEGMESNRR